MEGAFLLLLFTVFLCFLWLLLLFLLLLFLFLLLFLLFCFACCSCSHCCYDCCYCSSCCSSCSCCSRSCCSCSRCGCGCEPVLDCFRYFLSSPVIGFRADLPHNISLCTDSTYTRLWDYKYKRLWSRNKREWTVNESLSISPCRLSLVQVFMLLRVMRLHDLIIHWVRMSWLIYVSMFLVEPNSCNAAQYIHVYIWSAHIYALCKDSNSMTKDCFYLGHAVNG